MEATDPYAGLPGRFYSFYIARPRLARVVGPVLWGSDFRPLYRQLEGLSQLPHGTVLLDAACGAGLAFRWLNSSAGVRYIGVDSSPAMLRRARRAADRLGHEHAELHLADVASLPLPDAAAQVGLLSNALHCVQDPQAVVDEVVRCIEPGGRLLGSMLIRGAVTRADRLMEADTTGLTGPGGTLEDLRHWMEARLTEVQLTTAGALALFSARVPPSAHPDPRH